MKRIECYVIAAGFYPEGATVYVIRGEYVFFHAINGECFVWFSTLSNAERLETIVSKLPSGEYDTLGTGCTGTYSEMMKLIFDTINR